MNQRTVIDTLIAEGIEPSRIVVRFDGAGLHIGIRIQHPTDQFKWGIVHDLVPIDDAQDEAFAKRLVRAASDQGRKVE